MKTYSYIALLIIIMIYCFGIFYIIDQSPLKENHFRTYTIINKYKEENLYLGFSNIIYKFELNYNDLYIIENVDLDTYYKYNINDNYIKKI